MIRGGSWNNNARNCRSANRNNNDPGNRNNNLGFRLLQFIVMSEVYCLWIVCQYVDNDQTALQCRYLPDKEMYKLAASGRDLESGGGFSYDSDEKFKVNLNK